MLAWPAGHSAFLLIQGSGQVSLARTTGCYYYLGRRFACFAFGGSGNPIWCVVCVRVGIFDLPNCTARFLAGEGINQPRELELTGSDQLS